MTPIFFNISDITNSSSLNGKIFRKKSISENFRANVLKPATTGEDFTLGYFGEENKKFTIKSEFQICRGFIIGKTEDGYVVGGPAFT